MSRSTTRTIISWKRCGGPGEELCRRIKQQIEHATKKDLVKPREGVRLVEFYESQMLAKTYLNIEQKVGRRNTDRRLTIAATWFWIRRAAGQSSAVP